MSEEKKTLNFIEQIVEKDLLENKHGGRILTRFPPEPNGYLHIGHAKSIVLNFGLAQKYGGKTNLRFDDTNPTTEDVEYVDSILEDVRWLGYSWNGDAVYASDYFEQLYEFALALIKKGLAYVDDSSAEEIAAMKGTPTEPGIESPFRNRSVEENLDLFERMRTGEFGDGQKVLRAKVDMAAPNMHLRDPLMYRIKKARHHRTGDKWNIYPMYDFAHGQSDSIEQITHSICTLEFEVHRPLYEWFIQKLEIFPSRQIEFARLNLSYTIMSKRRLLKLVEGKYVSGWDDPRMPTISGLRRRGYTPESIRNFADRIGIARRENVIDVSLLEFSVREHLNKIAKRVMVVMDPIKMVITNYPAGQNELLDSVNNPEDDQSGSRQLIFSNTLYIERDDFMVEPQKGFYRLGPGLSVRLKDAYKVTCENFVLDEATGKVKEIHCLYHPDSKSGQDTSSVNVKATIHWVDVNSAVNMEIRLYDRLFLDEAPDGHKDKDFLEFLNPDSLKVIQGKAEASLKDATTHDHFQFMRMGYFCPDPDSSTEKLIFNRTVTLKDAWQKQKGKN
ncbi:MAG TPA: glutamine--tRNA ligase/YqeY domain fusion protein [Saprospiraceae bacterium]|nr:glutamine--tRNA ligase/YqeY domain fusion protein [Saprospiraceae bacterium]